MWLWTTVPRQTSATRPAKNGTVGVPPHRDEPQTAVGRLQGVPVATIVVEATMDFPATTESQTVGFWLEVLKLLLSTGLTLCQQKRCHFAVHVVVFEAALAPLMVAPQNSAS